MPLPLWGGMQSVHCAGPRCTQIGYTPRYILAYRENGENGGERGKRGEMGSKRGKTVGERGRMAWGGGVGGGGGTCNANFSISIPFSFRVLLPNNPLAAM